MRKVSFILILAFASTVGVAQTEYKLEKGDVTTELQLSLFSTNATSGYGDDSYFSAGPLSLSGLRLRFALSEKIALRLTLGLDMGHSRIKDPFVDDTTYNDSYYEGMTIRNGSIINNSRYTQFLIAPGFEYHFGNWERMSVYVGGEVFFGMRTTLGKLTEDVKSDYYTPDYWEEGNPYRFRDSMHLESSLTEKNCRPDRYGDYEQTGKMFFGLNAVIGMDFYVYKGLYLGAELGLGYQADIYLKGTVKGETFVNGVSVDNVDIKLKTERYDGNLAFKCNPMIRIGWKF